VKNVIIKQFTVRHQGQDYGPGEIISGLSDDEAKQLIAGSNGKIAELSVKIEASNTVSQAEKTNEEQTSGLPEIDPGKTVKQK
jgi:hypothetical protein